MIARARMLFKERGVDDFSATHMEALGAEASYGPQSRARASREVLLRLVVEHASRDAIELFGRELGSVGISFAPGTTGIYNGRPKPTPVVRLFTFFSTRATSAHPVSRSATVRKRQLMCLPDLETFRQFQKARRRMKTSRMSRQSTFR